MSTLRASLQGEAQSFTEQVMATIRGANLEELLDSGGGRAGSDRSGATVGNAKRKAPRARVSGRLRRRSAEEIEAILGKVVGLLKKHKEGMRAETIRAELGMQAKEMPRVLKHGLSVRKLKAKGQKRARTYFST